eukprot:g1454.t1
MWEISFWSTQFLTWFLIPLFMGYVDSGRFSIPGKFLNSLKDNLMFYGLLLVLSLFGLMFVIIAGNLSVDALSGTCIALTNMFGLVVVVFLMGYGLVSVPRMTWKFSDPELQLQQTHYDLEKLTEKVQEAISEMERVNLVVHASAQQISRRDAIRPYMDIVWNEFLTSNVSGLDLERGRNLSDHLKLLTTEELDYALDLRGLVELRRRVRNAATRFEGVKMEYILTVQYGMNLHELCKRRRNKDYSDDSTNQPTWIRTVYWYVLCNLSPVFRKLAALMFMVMSMVVVWSELVIIGEKTYLSPIHFMMKKAKTEWAIYWVILLPLVYMFFCTYHTLFNLAAFKFYHLIRKASSPYSLLLNGSLMCRFAAPLAYNFLHALQVIQNENPTAFSQVMGSMEVLPFVGNRFNSVLPIFLLIHCLLIWMNAWKRVVGYFVPVKFQYNEDNADEEQSAKGRILLLKEQESLQQGKQIGFVLGIDSVKNKHTPSVEEFPEERLNLGAPLASSDDSTAAAAAGPSHSSSLDNIFSSFSRSNGSKTSSLETRESQSRSKKWFP